MTITSPLELSVFKMAAFRILDFKILKFLVARQIRGLMCIVVRNFIKIGRTAAEILHLTFFKMVAVRHLFLN